MSLDALSRRLAELPMLRIALCMAGGVLLERHFELPTTLLILTLLVAGLGSILLRKWYAYLLTLLSAGYLVATFAYAPPTEPYREPALLQVRILDDGTLRTRNTRHEARLEGWQTKNGEQLHPNGGRLWLYADSTLRLSAGERLRYQGKIYPFHSDSTAWSTTMLARGYVGRCYLNPYNFPERLAPRKPSLHQRASRRMQNLLKSSTDAAATVRAMTVGDRSGIHPTLRESYSRSGLSHLLAVSGLHTGMLFVVINLLVWWLPLFHRGHRLKHLLSIGAVWLFVAAAGFSVSAVRAAVMCTILQWALLSTSTYRALNSWAAAAVLLLAIRPGWLFDIGFELSFVAVGAILCWALPLCRVVRGRFRLLNYLTDMLVVSFVAWVATAPLISHHFGIVSLLGVLINPPAILLGTGVVAVGLILLLLPPLAPILRPVVLQLAEWQNSLAAWCASIEGATLDLRLSGSATATIYLIFVVLTLVLWCRDRKKQFMF